jgi:hypothetical protein
MPQNTDLKLLDRRTAERRIQAGLLDEKTWEEHLKSLPDVSEKAVTVSTRMFDDEQAQARHESAAESEGAGEEGLGY